MPDSLSQLDSTPKGERKKVGEMGKLDWDDEMWEQLRFNSSFLSQLSQSP